ncbi:unnamed protein product, partial [Ectocarpus sp. 12 AP-2014]
FLFPFFSGLYITFVRSSYVCCRSSVVNVFRSTIMSDISNSKCPFLIFRYPSNVNVPSIHPCHPYRFWVRDVLHVISCGGLGTIHIWFSNLMVQQQCFGITPYPQVTQNF